MPAALVGLSHSPLIGSNDPVPEVVAEVEAAISNAKSFIADFGPDLVVLYAPDHYNGFFYKQMPPFCLATEATSVGDFSSTPGPLSVDEDAANAIAAGVLARGIDLSVSARMTVDHGMVQPLEELFGGIDAIPVVPIYINGVCQPLGPVSRIRALGTAVGETAAELDKRVLFIGSGGLSHDPPVPVLDGAPPRVRDALIEGHAPPPEVRKKGEQRVIQAGRDYAAGSTTMLPLSPEWDNLVLDTLAGGNLDEVDSWTVDWFTENGGGSSHEVRCWIAAFASLAATGPYAMTSRYYRAIPEWIAGYAVATAAHT